MFWNTDLILYVDTCYNNSRDTGKLAWSCQENVIYNKCFNLPQWPPSLHYQLLLLLPAGKLLVAELLRKILMCWCADLPKIHSTTIYQEYVSHSLYKVSIIWKPKHFFHKKMFNSIKYPQFISLDTQHSHISER